MLGKVLKLEVQLKLLPRAIVQPTPLSALLDRPGLQLLYCLIRAGRLGVGEEGVYGAVYTSTPHAQPSTHGPETPNQRAWRLLKVFCTVHLIYQ